MSDHCYYVLPCDSESDPLHRRTPEMTAGYGITSGWLTCPCQLGGSGLLVLPGDKTNKTTVRSCFAMKNSTPADGRRWGKLVCGMKQNMIKQNSTGHKMDNICCDVFGCSMITKHISLHLLFIISSCQDKWSCLIGVFTLTILSEQDIEEYQ